MSKIDDLRRGTDSSGRPLLATDRFWRAWQAILRHPRVQPFRSKIVPVQGAFMALLGGGAAESAGYHDKAACWDVRTWNLTAAEEQTLWEVAELYGIHFWKRDKAAAHGGMDEHGHALTLWDVPKASGAEYQLQQAKAKRDGLASNGPDYMKRKTPLVLEFPAELIARGEDDMADPAIREQLNRIEEGVQAAQTVMTALSDAERARYKQDKDRQTKRFQKLVAKLGGLADELEGDARAKVLQILADEPDVTGPDNPADKEA